MVTSRRSIGVSTAVLAAIVMTGFTVTSCAAPSTVQTKSPLHNKDGGKSETPIGSLAADAVKLVLKADLAFVAASELKPTRDPFPAGTASSDQIASVISYQDDPLALLDLKGSTIRAALEKALSIYPQPNLGFLQVAGVQVEFDPSKPSGNRVVSVKIGDSPLEDDRAYSVGVTNSMANGALGYWKLWKAADVKKRVADTSITKAIEELFRSKSSIDYGKPLRIKAKQ